MAKKDLALYAENPELYSNYNNINTGRILAIIGIVLSSIMLLVTIYSKVVIGDEGMMKMQKEMLEELHKSK